MYGGTKKALTLLLWGALGAGGLYVGLRWLLPWMAPFLIAAALARLIEPVVNYLRSQRWPRSLAAGVCTTAMLAAVGLILRLVVGGVVGELKGLAAQMPALVEGITRAVGKLEGWLRRTIDNTGGALESYLLSALDALPEQLGRLPSALSARILGFLSGFAGRTPAILLFTVTTCLGVYFISASYPEIMRFLQRQIPLRWRSRAEDMRKDLKGTLGHWLKAQLMMAGFTFGELLLAFFLLKLDYAILLALLTAVIDALPVLGAGAVLLPWAAVEFLTGNYPLGVGLVITYGAVTLVRQCIQAKLLGDQLGLHPVASLVAVYIGYRAMGVWGMLLFPMLFITLKQLNDRGVLTLWRKEDAPHASQ